MVLIVQIALGVVLGFVLLALLPSIIQLGKWVVGLFVVALFGVGALVFVKWYLGQPDAFTFFLVAAPLIALPLWYSLTSDRRAQAKALENRRKAGYR